MTVRIQKDRNLRKIIHIVSLLSLLINHGTYKMYWFKIFFKDFYLNGRINWNLVTELFSWVSKVIHSHFKHLIILWGNWRSFYLAMIISYVPIWLGNFCAHILWTIWYGQVNMDHMIWNLNMVQYMEDMNYIIWYGLFYIIHNCPYDKVNMI